MMEQSIEKLDFEETDQMVQVHGTFSLMVLERGYAYRWHRLQRCHPFE